MADSSKILVEAVQSNRRGARIGICSICSANRYVLEAAMLQADCRPVCIESTSNQVNQFGGYSGLVAREFSGFVRGVAMDTGFPPERIILGGDHLGPFPWQDEPAESAMAKSRELVRSCVSAGYSKIHLDASMRCADDPGGEHAPLDERTVTGRAAELCRAAEEAHAALPAGSPAPLYVIGTEVPVPGGEQGDWQLAVTRTEDLQRTIDLTREAFLAKGLQDAWQRVIAVVVQPGVEFGDTAVIEYDREKARDLSAYISRIENLVYEAHSTDYQTREALRHLVEDHFAVLKVGPWLTFAFREAVFALDSMEAEWLAGRKGIELSSVRQALDAAMLADPRHWKRYYRGDESAVRFARKYSYSDRSRYYWMQPAVQAALQKLLANLAAHPFPATLISQHMPEEYEAVREDRIAPSPSDLIRHRIAKVLRVYSYACTPPAA